MQWGCWCGVLSQETKACCCSQGNRMTLLRRRRGKNKRKMNAAGSWDLATRSFRRHVFPKASHPLPPSTHLPTSCHVRTSTRPQRGSHHKRSPQPRPWRVAGLVLQLQGLPNMKRTDAQITLLQVTPWAGQTQSLAKRREGRKQQTQKGREEERKKSEQGRKGEPESTLKDYQLLWRPPLHKEKILGLLERPQLGGREETRVWVRGRDLWQLASLP